MFKNLNHPPIQSSTNIISYSYKIKINYRYIHTLFFQAEAMGIQCSGGTSYFNSTTVIIEDSTGRRKEDHIPSLSFIIPSPQDHYTIYISSTDIHGEDIPSFSYPRIIREYCMEMKWNLCYRRLQTYRIASKRGQPLYEGRKGWSIIQRFQCSSYV